VGFASTIFAGFGGPILESRMRQFAIVGGTGFVGRAVLERSLRVGEHQTAVLIHRSNPDWLHRIATRVVTGDASDPVVLDRLIIPGATVLNLIRPNGNGRFPHLVQQLVNACVTRGARRLIHCSSIDVFGACRQAVIEENTAPQPVTSYEREHFEAEQVVVQSAARLDAAILRLGAVFGPGGRNIVAIAKEAAAAPLWRLALRRSLYGRRRMHLVPVETAAAAISHLAFVKQEQAGRMFVLTDDEMAENNFLDLLDLLMNAFGRARLDWAPVFPPTALEVALAIRGRSNTNAMRRFHTPALGAIGFRKPISFVEALRAYADQLHVQ
jgi:nucleoside-diphosphate-sugar epimerase